MSTTSTGARRAEALRVAVRPKTRQVLDLILRVRERGLPVILISHDMPNVFELADRIQIMRLGRRVATVTPRSHTMPEAVSIMTGAIRGDSEHALKE